MPPREATPINTAVERDLYSFTHPDGTLDVSVETELFTKVEGQTKPILDKWARSPCRLTRSDIEMVLLYISLQHVRVPAMIRTNKEFEEKFAMEYVKWLANQPDEVDKMWRSLPEGSRSVTWKDRSEFEAHLKDVENLYSIEVDPKRALAASLMQVQAIHRELMQLVPSICVTNVSTMYATSDSPINVFAPTGDGKAIFGAGFGLPTVEVVFPFSPFHALYLSRKGEPGWYDVDGRTVDEFNRRCVRGSDRYIMASYFSKRILRYLEEFKDSYRKSRIDGNEVAAVVEKAFVRGENS